MKNGQNWEKTLFSLRSKKASGKIWPGFFFIHNLGGREPREKLEGVRISGKNSKGLPGPCSGLWPGAPEMFWHLIAYQWRITCPQSRAPISISRWPRPGLLYHFQPSLNSTPFIFFQFGWNQPKEIGPMITASSSKKDNGQISLVGVLMCSAISMSL